MVAGHLQEKKGHWYIVLNLHDKDGKRTPKWIATHLPVQGNKRKAEELLTQARQKYIDPFKPQEDDRLLFDVYIRQWLERMKTKVAPSTYLGYKRVVENGICPYFEQKQIPLNRLRPVDLEKYYAELQNQGLSGNTVIHYHANIHKALKDAVRLDLIDRNPAEAVERPRKEKFLPAHYSVEEANELLYQLKGHWLELPITLALFYGLRRSEVLGLQWKSVDFSAHTLTIQHTRIYEDAGNGLSAIGHDTVKRKSSYRTLPMPEPMQELLLSAKRDRYGDGVPNGEDYICLNRDGAPIGPDYLTQSFKKFLRDNDLREIRLHDLRRTSASILIQNRVPLIEVQQWLGHSTLETTADLYAHLEYDSKVNAAELLKNLSSYKKLKLIVVNVQKL